uniref:Macoilin (inferred by orthology to a human protein) n=1 Tax=Strongyloides venezuelensis TaxID=75913 RepID=A0A0K0G087_STRVS
MIKRTRGEGIPKPKRSIKKVSKIEGNESCSLSFFQYIKLFLVWILFLSIDMLTGFRVELLWPFWLYIRNCCEKNNLNNNLTKYLKYPDLTFVFLIHIATVDLIFCLFVPVPFMLIVATAWVWTQYIYYSSDRSWSFMSGIFITLSVLFEIYGRSKLETHVWSGKSFLAPNSLTLYTTKTDSYFEGTENMEYIGDINDEALNNSNTKDYFTFTVLDFCKPFAAHCISYPILCFVFSLFKYYYLWKEDRERKTIILKNTSIYDIMCDAVNSPKNNYDYRYKLTGINLETVTNYNNDKENYYLYDGDIVENQISKNNKNYENLPISAIMDTVTNEGSIKKFTASQKNNPCKSVRKQSKCNGKSNKNSQYNVNTIDKKDSSKESINSEELDDTDSISTASWSSNVEVVKHQLPMKNKKFGTLRNIYEFLCYLTMVSFQYISNMFIKNNDSDTLSDNSSLTSEECSEEEYNAQEDDFFQLGENGDGNKDCYSSRESPSSSGSISLKENKKKIRQRGRDTENRKGEHSNSPLKSNGALNNGENILYNYNDNIRDNSKTSSYTDKENEERMELREETNRQLKESNEMIENLKLQLKKKSSIEKDLRSQLVKCEIAEKSSKAELTKIKLHYEQLETENTNINKYRDQDKITITNLEKKISEVTSRKVELEKELKTEKQKLKELKQVDCNVTCKPRLMELESDNKKLLKNLATKNDSCEILIKRLEKIRAENDYRIELIEKSYEDRIKILNSDKERMQHTLSEETKFKQLLFKALLNAKEEAKYLKDYIVQKGYELPSPRKESDADEATNNFCNPWTQLSDPPTF